MFDFLNTLTTNEDVVDSAFWVMIVTGAVLVLFVIVLLWNRLAGNKRDSAPGIDFGQIDRVRDKAGLSEAEYKAIRQSIARRELERQSDQSRIEQERAILEQAALNPEAARQLLEGQPAPSQAAKPQIVETQTMPEPIDEKTRIENELRAQLGLETEPTDQVTHTNVDSQPTTELTQLNEPEPKPAPPESRQVKTELDTLYEKGILNQEEYERLKTALRDKNGQ